MAVLSLEEFEVLFRPLAESEKPKAQNLIQIVHEMFQQEAVRYGKNLDKMIEEGSLTTGVLQSVIADVVGRTLMTSTNQEPTTQFSQSALGYSVSGSYLVPGGGVYIKKSELARLGIRRQRYGVMDVYGTNQRD